MKITNDLLKKRFSKMRDDELVELLKHGGLTNAAKSIINNEINTRNISADKPTSEETISRKCVQKTRGIKSRLASGFLGSLAGMGFGVSFFISNVKNEAAETALHLVSGVLLAIIFFIIFIFFSKDTARKWAVVGIAVAIVLFIPDLIRTLTR